ncbi:MAG: putative Ig domain-containing protein [Candidatus Acidiferrales bacterium]
MPRRCTFALAFLLALVTSCVLGCSSTGVLIVTGGVTPNATIGVAYNSSLTVSNGTGTYLWTVQNLPPGITASGTSSSTLVLSGTPTTAGAFTIAATVTDTKSRTVTYTGTITVSTTAALAINGSLPFTGTIGTPYSGTLSATGGVAPYSWVIDTLPGGVTATGTNSATVTVSGTPTASGSFQVAITLTDSANNTAKSSITVSISSSATLAINGSLPATGAIGAAYSGSLTATGGTTPYTWSVSNLPAGITASGLDTATVSISGSPTTAATYNVSALVTDSKNDTALYSVAVIVSATQGAACAVPFAPGGNEAALTKPYAFVLQGADSTGQPVAWAGSFTPDGNGGISTADVDEISEVNGPSSYQIDLAGSSYSFSSEGNGCLALALHGIQVPPSSSPRVVSGAGAAATALANASMEVFRFELSTPYQTGRVARSDSAHSPASPSGRIHQQTPADFALAQLSPRFAFGIDGWLLSSTETLERVAMAGNFTFASPDETHFDGIADNDMGGDASGQLVDAAGTITAPSAATGRGIGTYTIATPHGNVSFDFAYYVLSGSDLFLISTDAAEPGDFLLTGRALAAASPSTSLYGSYTMALTGLDFATASANTARNVVQLSSLTFDSGVSVDPETGRATFSIFGDHSPIAYLTSNDGGDSIAAFLVGRDSANCSGFLLSRPPSTTSPSSLLGDFQTRAAQYGAQPWFRISGPQLTVH